MEIHSNLCLCHLQFSLGHILRRRYLSYHSAGGVFLNPMWYTPLIDNEVWSILRPFVIYMIVVGSFTLVIMVIEFLWICNVTTGVKWSISFASMMLNSLSASLFFSIGIGASCYCTYLQIKYFPYTDFSAKCYNTGVALAICSYIGSFYSMIVLGLKMHNYVLNRQSVNEASMNDIR